VMLSILASDGNWTVQGQLGRVAVVMSGPLRSPINEPLHLRLVVTGPAEDKVIEPRFVSEVGDGTLIGMTAFGPDPTGPFESRGWVLLIKPQERGGLSLPEVEIGLEGKDGEGSSLRLAVPTIEVIDSVTSQWESVGTFFVWAGVAGLVVFFIGGAMTLARSNKSELAG
jgi:hypothetical protein